MNSQEVSRKLDINANPIIKVNSIGSNPDGPLQRCEGSCGNNDKKCADGLFCMVNTGHETIPGCKGNANLGWDYCVDINDFTNYGFTLLSTGGWNEDWHISQPLEINLKGEQKHHDWNFQFSVLKHSQIHLSFSWIQYHSCSTSK